MYGSHAEPVGAAPERRSQSLKQYTSIHARRKGLKGFCLYVYLLEAMLLLLSCREQSVYCVQGLGRKAKVYGRVEVPGEHGDSFIFDNITVPAGNANPSPGSPHKYSRFSKAWSLPLMKGIMKGQTLHLRKIEDHPNKWHSCYEVHCENTWKNFCPDASDPASTHQFCYPAVVVTGLPKCGTSAAYDLLSRYNGSVIMYTKENCPYTHRRSHWEFFHTLPNAADVHPGQLVVDGCLDYLNNMRLRRLLHEPETLYVIMTRNYADLVWSSYNFWCKREYDGVEGCDNPWFAHKPFNRSADLLHGMVLHDQAGMLTKHDAPFHGDLVRPCVNGGGFVKEHVEYRLWTDRPGQFITRATDPEHTLLMASEELEAAPLLTWSKVARHFGMTVHQESGDTLLPAAVLADKAAAETAAAAAAAAPAPAAVYNYNFHLGNFRDIRQNTQEKKGADLNIPVAAYRPGVFSISDYEPLREDTRALLDRCWLDDCVWVSQMTGYTYPVCAKQVEAAAAAA